VAMSAFDPKRTSNCCRAMSAMGEKLKSPCSPALAVPTSSLGPMFSLLRDEGRRSAQVFLESHASDLGHRSTLDLDVLLEQSTLGEQFYAEPAGPSDLSKYSISDSVDPSSIYARR
jgi:hypothetical protein